MLTEVGRTCEEISYTFEVDFHVGHFDQVLKVGRTGENALEDELRNAGDDTLQVLIVDVRSLLECFDSSVRTLVTRWL